MRRIGCCLLLACLLLCLSMAGALGEDPFGGMRVYEEGQYWVGVDMLPGEYVLLSTSSLSGYFSVTSDANGRDILFNDLFETNSIVTVNRGEYIKLNRCLAVSSEDFYSRYSIKTGNEGVMLKVGYGYDLTPGTYKLTALAGQRGYYCIYNSSRWGRIVANDLFSNSSYVTVTAGPYLVLERCHLVP